MQLDKDFETGFATAFAARLSDGSQLAAATVRRKDESTDDIVNDILRHRPARRAS